MLSFGIWNVDSLFMGGGADLTLEKGFQFQISQGMNRKTRVPRGGKKALLYEKIIIREDYYMRRVEIAICL